MVRYQSALAVAVCALALISGLTWAFTHSPTWNENRAAGELGRFGHSVTDLINNKQDVTGPNRPPRWGLPDDGNFPDGMASMISSNAAFYNGQAAVGGYLNITRTETWQIISESVNGQSEQARNARAFWAAPGRIFQLDDQLTTPDVDTINRCDHVSICGADIVSQASIWYDPRGSWEYQIETSNDLILGTNEAFYPGFTIQATNRIDGQDIYPIPVMAPGGFLAFHLPAGDWQINIVYTTPGMAISWVFWWVGFAIAAGYSGLLAYRWLKRRKTPPNDANKPFVLSPEVP